MSQTHRRSVRHGVIVGTLLFFAIWMLRTELMERITGEPKTVEAFQRIAVTAIKQKDPGVAITALQKAVQLNPNRAEIQYTLAQALETAGRKGEAIKAYQASIAAHPGLAAPHYNLAVLYQARGDFAATEAELREAVRLYPDFTMAHLLLGTLFYGRGEWGAAVTEFRRVLKQPNATLTDRVTLHMMLGDACVKLGLFEEASQHFATVLTISPGERAAQKALDSLPKK